jgi:O-antigen ligase
MGSPDAALPVTASASVAADGSDDWSRSALALALVLPWWLPILGSASATFYKEILTLLLVGFAGVIALSPARRPDKRVHPLAATALVLALVVVLQGAVIEGTWRKGAMILVGLVVFWVCLRCGLQLRERLGDKAFAWLTRCAAIAALGSCVFAALQMLGLDETVPGVVRRAGSSRLTGNVAQSNQFADLLWVAVIGVAWLVAVRRAHWAAGLAVVVVLEFFAVTSGSRTVWLYVGLSAAAAGMAAWRGNGNEVRRRLAIGLIGIALAQVAISLVMSASGVLTAVNVTSSEGRGDSAESNAQRLWFWRSGVAIAAEHPLLGVGAGRLAGALRERTLTSADAPRHGADAHAHNLFVQVAAELGIPAAIALAVGLGGWLLVGLRGPPLSASAVAALVMSGVMLIHANLEHPFSYLYVLALFGVVAAQVPTPGFALPSGLRRPTLPPQILRIVSFALIVAGIAAYISYMPVERATQVLRRQVGAGAPPHPDQELAARLNAVQPWSPYVDFAETIGLMVSVPNESTALELASRCERAVAFGPTPFLLARCAADLQVARQRERAADFARSLCRLYPEAAGVLQQSTAFVARTTPAAADLLSTCDTTGR